MRANVTVFAAKGDTISMCSYSSAVITLKKQAVFKGVVDSDKN